MDTVGRPLEFALREVVRRSGKVLGLLEGDQPSPEKKVGRQAQGGKKCVPILCACVVCVCVCVCV